MGGVRLCIRGYAPLVIPSDLFVPMKGSFGGETPYVAKIAARFRDKGYIGRKLPLKILCLESLYDRMNDSPYKSYYDPMAGIGISARIFGHGSAMRLNDFDKGCTEVLRRNFSGITVTSEDITKMPLSAADLVFLDFNDFTMKRGLGKYQPILVQAFNSAYKYLVINDCSIFYLRYGAAAFAVYSKLLGAKITSLQSYFEVLREWYAEKGWCLIQVAYFGETAFLLLSRRTSNKFVCRNLGKEPVPYEVVGVEEKS